eukprot:352494-Chlamydomonas_euryale.AAC.2
MPRKDGEHQPPREVHAESGPAFTVHISTVRSLRPPHGTPGTRRRRAHSSVGVICLPLSELELGNLDSVCRNKGLAGGEPQEGT